MRREKRRGRKDGKPKLSCAKSHRERSTEGGKREKKKTAEFQEKAKNLERSGGVRRPRRGGFCGWIRRERLTEAQEQRVHAHAVDAEEAVGDEVGAHDHRLEGKRD